MSVLKDKDPFINKIDQKKEKKRHGKIQGIANHNLKWKMVEHLLKNIYDSPRWGEIAKILHKMAK